MRNLSGLILVAVVCLALGGCDKFLTQAFGTPGYNQNGPRHDTLTGPDIDVITDVDGISDNTAHFQKTYVLIPANEGVQVQDLMYKEFISYIRNALTERGWQEMEDPHKADVVIGVGYGIGPPEKHVTTNLVPLIGQTGYSSSSTMGNVSAYGNTATYSGTTTNTPTYGVTGYATKVTENTTYTRYLILDAYDLQQFYKNKQLIPFWRTTISSVGPTDDLRLIMPGLVTAGLDYYGQDTAGKQRIRLNLSSPEVYQVRTGHPVPAPAPVTAPAASH